MQELVMTQYETGLDGGSGSRRRGSMCVGRKAGLGGGFGEGNIGGVDVDDGVNILTCVVCV